MRLGAVLVTGLKVSLWFTLRSLFILARDLIWILCGIQHQIRTNRKSGAYSGTAHVRNIKRRFKMDLMIQPANLNNFITTHHSFVDPEYVLQSHVTLYSLTQNEAVFVESEPNVNATSSAYSSFFRIAQFKLAKRVIVLPMHVFHALGEQVGDPPGRLVFLTNTSRCGSTLLTQVFEETGRSIAISEPDAMYAISALKEKADADPTEVAQLTVSTVRMLCKPVGPNMDTFVIKLSQQTMCLTPDLVELFPQSKHLFMYRNGLKVAQSVAKLMRSLPYLELMMVVAGKPCCMNVARRITAQFGLPTSDFDNVGSLICPLYCGAIVWASSIHKYLEFKRALLPVVAVRYEDMTKDPHYSMKQIFDYCALEYQPEATDRAFARDSQENSPISRDLLKQFKQNNMISEETTRNLDSVCDIFQVPKLYELYIAEDTITYKPKARELHTAPLVAFPQTVHASTQLHVHTPARTATESPQQRSHSNEYDIRETTTLLSPREHIVMYSTDSNNQGSVKIAHHSNHKNSVAFNIVEHSNQSDRVAMETSVHSNAKSHSRSASFASVSSGSSSGYSTDGVPEQILIAV